MANGENTAEMAKEFRFKLAQATMPARVSKIKIINNLKYQILSSSRKNIKKFLVDGPSYVGKDGQKRWREAIKMDGYE